MKCDRHSGLAMANTRPLSLDGDDGEGGGIAGLRAAASPPRAAGGSGGGRGPSPPRDRGHSDSRVGGRDGRGAGGRDSEEGLGRNGILLLVLVRLNFAADWRKRSPDRGGRGGGREAEGSYTRAPPPPGLKLPPPPELQDPELCVACIFFVHESV
jgi:hypothetical protein